MTGGEPARGAGRRDRDDGIAIALHWSSAAAIGCAFWLGLGELPTTPDKVVLVGYRQWLSLTVVALTGVRIDWRFARPAWELSGAIPA